MKNQARRIFALWLILFLLIPSFAACSTERPDGEEPSADVETTESSSSEESTTESESESESIFDPDGGVYIDEVSIYKYRVVIPNDADLSTKYAAMNLTDYLSLHFGVQIPTVTDKETEKEYEILIGDTNRDESTVEATLLDAQFILMKENKKIVMQGDGIYVGAGVGYFISHYLSDAPDGVNVTDLPETEQPKTFSFAEGTPKNVILMIGDGMGYNHINLALANGLDEFVAQQLTQVGSAVTRSQSVINGVAVATDSAAAATALSTGYKTFNGYVGIDVNKQSLQNVRELAHAYGAKTAVVTTDALTGATPAGFLAHDDSRHDSDDLKGQINALIADGLVDYCKGSVSDGLTEHTRAALAAISDTDAPFFMMCEGAYIDKYSHQCDYDGTIMAVKRFNDAIAYVIQFVFCHPDTALIVTADHETGGLVEHASSYGYRYTTDGNHTNLDVPLYAIGPATRTFDGKATDNTDISRFMAKSFGATAWGAEQ